MSGEVQESSTNKSYPCKLCGLRFFWLSDLQSHLLSHAHGKICVSSYSSPVSQKKTQQDEKSNDAKPNADLLKRTHKRQDTAANLNTSFRPYRCGLCGNRFQQLSDLKLHHLSHQTQEDFLEKGTSERKKDSSNNTCIKCGKIFMDSSERDKHGCSSQHPYDLKEAESSPKPRVTFQCSVCGKGFGLLCVYQRHQRYHRRELAGEIHKCPRCPRRFRQSSALIRHVETHQSLSPGEDDKEVQTSPTTASGQDPTLVLEHDEDLDEEDDLEEEEGSGSIAAEVLYECTECTQTFSSLVTFLQHQSAHGSDSLG
ncbi:zinc finger protein 184-like [Arapaima gigas]